MSDTKLTAEESCRSVLKSIVDACDQESLARAGGYLFRYVQEETVLRDCGQRGVCRTPPGCARHWEERNRELVRENEVLRSNSDHLSSENASLSSQVEAMAMRIESLSEELAKPEDMRLREVLEALDGRAVIFDGLGARVGHLLDEMDEWIARAGESERLADERLAHANQLQADIEAEMQGRLELRKRLGAREDETMGAFLERLATMAPLTATPLADRIEELEAQRDVRQQYGDRMKDERDAALARVKELEREAEESEQDSHAWDKAMDEEEKAFAKGANEWMHHLLGPDWGRFWGPHLEAFGRGVDNMMVRVGKAEAERDAALERVKDLKTALHLEREAHERALREVLDQVVRAKMMEPPPPLLLAPDVAERDALKAQLAEAVGALRGLRDEVSGKLTGRDSEPGQFEKAWQTACAFLAKVKP